MEISPPDNRGEAGSFEDVKNWGQRAISWYVTFLRKLFSVPNFLSLMYHRERGGQEIAVIKFMLV
jgi:hypothetical protein